MGYAFDILAPANITRVMQETQSRLTMPRPLLWSERANKVQASEDELTMKEKSHVFAADIIAADARALIRDTGQFSFERHEAVKLKHGFAISESQIRTIRRIEGAAGRGGTPDPQDIFSFQGYIGRRSKELLMGIEQRREAMINGMLQDSFSYDRLGIKGEGTFGMPSDLKFVPETSWDEDTATPILDIINVLKYAVREYGEGYDRITISYEILTAWVATTEFKNIYKENAFTFAIGSNSTTNAQSANPQFHLQFIANFISGAMSTLNGGRPVTIEIDEGVYREYSQASTVNGVERFHPVNKVYFTNSADDNASSGWDVGQGEVIESLIGSLGGANLLSGKFDGAMFGPVGYATQADPNLNPPGAVLWAVAYEAPRKLRDTCSAVLTAW